MNIRELINLLEEYERQSVTNVEVNLSVGVWSINCSVPAEIEDVMISYGEENEAHLEIVVSPEFAKKAMDNYEKYYKGFLDDTDDDSDDDSDEKLPFLMF